MGYDAVIIRYEQTGRIVYKLGACISSRTSTEESSGLSHMWASDS